MHYYFYLILHSTTLMKITINLFFSKKRFHSTQKNRIFQNPIFSLECYVPVYIALFQETLYLYILQRDKGKIVYSFCRFGLITELRNVRKL